MADLTIAQIAEKITDASLKTWVESWDELPEDIDTAEFLAKFHQAAYRAQLAFNSTDPAPQTAINAYQQPVYGSVALAQSTGIPSFTGTFAVQVRIAGDMDVAVAT